MNINNQRANTIYNVAGNLLIENSPEVAENLFTEKQAKLRELNSISFIDILNGSYESKKLIARSTQVFEIKQALDNSRELLLYGEPGIGKTTFIYQIAQKESNVIYISVKGRSPLSILLYLINKIRLSNGLDLVEISTLDEALTWLQSSLQKSNHLIILDDCENDTKTVSSIIYLEKFTSRFLYATRDNLSFEPIGIKPYLCKPFTEAEVREFLEQSNIITTTIQFNRLLVASQGNPLYLYYYSHFQIAPLPDNILEYQKAIWSQLDARQQEIVAFISLPYFSVTINDLGEFLKSPSILQIGKEIDSLATLVRNDKGTLNIFHPSFKEFIINTLGEKGALLTFQQKFGDYFLEQNDIIQATFLLIDVSPEKVEKFLFNVFPSLISWGELRLAVKAIETKLKSAKTNLEKGYLLYHLYHVEHLLGNKIKATNCIDEAVNLLTDVEEKKLYLGALMAKATNLLERGKVNEANELADTVLESIDPNDKELKALLSISLSKLYVDLSEFEKGAAICKEAFEIFSDLKDKGGMTSSLVNLVTCLAQIKGHKDDAEKYGLQILKIIDEDTDFGIEIVVLNALASIYRGKEEYEKAEEYNLRAIKLCQKYEMKDKTILNLINYGNTLRDKGDLPKAKEIYNEALVLVKEYNLKREEGRIYWILSALFRDEDNLTASIEFANKSISASSSVNFYYGLGNAYYSKHETLLLQGKKEEAAEALVASAEFYAKITEYSDSYQSNFLKAIRLYNNLGDAEKAHDLFYKLLQNTTVTLRYGDILLLLTETNFNATEADFEKLFDSYVSRADLSDNIVTEVLSFLAYCKTLESERAKKFCRIFLITFATNLEKAPFLHSILGIAIEQSTWLIDKYVLNDILAILTKKLSLFFVRSIDQRIILFASINNKINLELHTFEDELLALKLAVFLILILIESPDLVVKSKDSALTRYIVWYGIYSEDMAHAIGRYLPPVSEMFDEHRQTASLDAKSKDVREMVIIGKDYEVKGNLVADPNNKVSFYFLISSIMSIVHFFYDIDLRKSPAERKLILQKVGKLFDYTDTNLDNQDTKSKYEVDIDGAFDDFKKSKQ